MSEGQLRVTSNSSSTSRDRAASGPSASRGKWAAYPVLADELRAAIRLQEYSRTRQLPTEATLASEHSLSRQTVRRAYLELVTRRLVARIPGRGTFVADTELKYLPLFGSREDLMGLAADTTVEIVRPLGRKVDVEAAARLGLDNDIVHTVSYVRSHQGIPFGRTTVSLSPAVASLP
ncbi:GntR family transcriptional regulator [Mycobacterium sp. C31M]